MDSENGGYSVIIIRKTEKMIKNDDESAREERLNEKRGKSKGREKGRARVSRRLREYEQRRKREPALRTRGREPAKQMGAIKRE